MLAQRTSEDIDAKREFCTLVLPLSDTLYGMALRLTRNHACAEDLVQDSLVRAWRSWHTFCRGSNVKAWMHVILRNTFINEYHRSGRRARTRAGVDAERQVQPKAAIAGSGSTPPEPEAAAAELETVAKIHVALAQLPNAFRDSVILADIEGCEYKEIAATLDIPVGTVMSRVYRGRKILHGLLGQHATEIGMTVYADHR
jgi:RNA polymerase sigma-70 factor (ECF subfamily)